MRSTLLSAATALSLISDLAQSQETCGTPSTEIITSYITVTDTSFISSESAATVTVTDTTTVTAEFGPAVTVTITNFGTLSGDSPGSPIVYAPATSVAASAVSPAVAAASSSSLLVNASGAECGAIFTTTTLLAPTTIFVTLAETAVASSLSSVASSPAPAGDASAALAKTEFSGPSASAHNNSNFFAPLPSSSLLAVLASLPVSVTSNALDAEASTLASDVVTDAVDTSSVVNRGEATFYGGSVDGGMCSFSGYTIPSGVYGTALSDSNWNGAGACGECVQVTGPSGNSIKAMVVDQCPGCGSNHLDLFSDAFAALADPSKGVIDVDWQVVSCDIASPITLKNKSGTSAYWFSMQVVNSNVAISKLEVSTDSGSSWLQTSRQPYNYFEITSGTMTDSVTVRMTSTAGKVITVSGVSVASGLTKVTGSNF